MEALEHLETCVNRLLASLEALKKENSRLQSELLQTMREKTVLAEENHRLHESLTRQEGLRLEALRRIESLLLKIQEHGRVR